MWLARGYAVLSGPSLPIVAEGEEEPNDSYVQQLVGAILLEEHLQHDKGWRVTRNEQSVQGPGHSAISVGPLTIVVVGHKNSCAH